MGLKERANRRLAQGHTGTNSKRYTQFPANYPQALNRSQGIYVWDTHDRKYMDFMCGLGTSILGYNHQKVMEAVRNQLNRAVTVSLPTPLEVEVAELLHEMIPHLEKVRFLKSGSEACSAALRIARAHTSSDLVWSEGYHGWHDEFTSLTPPAIGVPGRFTDHVGYAVRHHRPTKAHKGGILITEPVQLDISFNRKKQLERDISNVDFVIYDEIVTGMRVEKYTVGRMWSLHPDMMCLGKAIANGFPLSVVGGSAEAMDDAEYFVSSTFSGEAVSLAACKATLQEIRKKSLKDLMYYGERLRSHLDSLHPDINFVGYGTRAMLNITERTTAMFCQEMAKSGFLFGKAWFFNFEHLEQEVEQAVMSAAMDCVGRINRGEVELEGDVPRDTFQR